MSDNWHLENAQKQLEQKRRQAGTNAPRAVEDVAKSLLDAPPPPPHEPPPDNPQRRPPERVTLDQLDTSHHPMVAKAVEAARKWADRKRQGHTEASLVLMGPAGVGKTHIARAILWSIVQTAVDDDGSPVAGTQRPVGRFFVADNLIQRLDTETWASNLVGSAPLIVIDDVGAEQTIAYVGGDNQRREKKHRYFKLINYCYDYRVSVIMTSNLGPADLRECIGMRSWSRLSQMAPAGFMLDMSAVPDYRIKLSGRGA